MWGTSGVELMGVIDSQLAWNTDSKGRHRTPRRPRTSFIESKQRGCIKHITKSDSMEKDLKGMDIPVSESEKLGVNILGHRFDGSLEGVPIKKRLLLAHSPSSSRGSPSNVSEVSDCILDSSVPHHVHKKMEPHRLSSSTFCDGVDFSGISILAAVAACSSPLSGCDIMNSEVSVFKDENLDICQNLPKSFASHEEAPSDAGVSVGKVDISGVSVAIQSVSAAEDGSCGIDLHMSNENVSCSNNTQFEGDNNNSRMVNTFKFHWDLNKEMDAWEIPDKEDSDFVERFASEDVCGNKHDVTEVCLGPVGHSMWHISPTTCHSSSRTGGVSGDIHVDSNLLNSLTDMEYVMNISLETYCADEQADNHCSSSDNPCATFGSDRETDACHKAISRTIDVQSSSNQLAQMTRDIQYPTGDSHDSMLTVTPSKISIQRSPSDEVFESTEIAFPTYRSASSKNTGLFADDSNNNREIDTAESDSCPCCHSVEDAESSDSSKERHGSPEQVDCNAGTINMDSCNSKEMESCNEPSTAASVSRTSSHGPCKSFSNAVVNMQGQFCSDIHPVGDCNYVAPAIAAGPEIVMEKLEQNGDDDSQYEDGELRESILQDWEIDAEEECEDEHVDYGSDDREHYMYEDALDSLVCRISPEKNDLELGITSEKSNILVSGQVSREGLETKSQPKCQSTEVAHGGTPHPCDDIGVRYVGRISKGDDHYMQSNHPASLKMSISGSEVAADSAKGLCKEDKIFEISDIVKGGTSFKKVYDSKNMRDLLSNCERGRSSEFSRSKDGTCHQQNRDGGDSNHTGKVDHGHVSSRKVGSFRLQEARSKGYPGEEPLKHWISSQQERHRYYSGYVKPAPKNAVEAAAAKVESNGFAVAPDGTVVKPSHLECAGWSSRRNSTATVQATYRSFPRRVLTGRDRIPQFKRDDVLGFNAQSKLRLSRRTSPDRCLNNDEGSFSHGIRMLSSGRKEKYGLQIASARINSSRRNRTISQRPGSPSQRNLSLPQRCGRSRSWSRSRSPNAWTSPRRNYGGRTVDDRGYRHRDMSPDFRADDRELVKVPYRHVNYTDRLPEFGQSSRNYPSLSSRPVHERKDSDNLGGHKYRIYRSSLEKSPSERSFSRSCMFDVADSGRMNQDEFFREIRRRHHDFAGSGKRSRYDMDNDGRGHHNRYEMAVSSSSREFEEMAVSSSSREFEELGGLKRVF